MSHGRRQENGRDLINRLAEEASEPRRVAVNYQYWKDQSAPLAPFGVLAALEVESQDVSPCAKECLEANDGHGADSASEWMRFRWRLSAFLELQDVFDVRIHQVSDVRVLFQQYYFYYESRALLAECVLSGLNGYYAASASLLRPFLEFNLLQLYHREFIERAGSYEHLEAYFRTGNVPSAATLIKRAIPDDAFCRPLRFRLSTHLAGLSSSSSHPYHPEYSPSQHRGANMRPSLEGLFFWHGVSTILEAVLWAYYVRLPLVLHAVPILRKFGLNGMVGTFVDWQCAQFARNSLDPDDRDAFVSYSNDHPDVRAGLEYVASLPDLSDEEIRSGWAESNGEFPGALDAYCMGVAKLRALRKGMALRARELWDVPEDLAGLTRTLKGWSELSRKGLRRNTTR